MQYQRTVKVHGVFSSSCGIAASSPLLQFHRVTRRDSGQIVTWFVQVGTYPTRNFAHILSDFHQSVDSSFIRMSLGICLFIVEAMLTIFSKPIGFKCSLLIIQQTIFENLWNSIFFWDLNGYFPKKGRMILWRFSSFRTLQQKRSAWFLLTTPHPIKLLILWSNLRSRSCWTTVSSGKIW